MNHNYSVYVHISPSTKLYIGITSKPVEIRWDNGRGYDTQKVFYSAIKKYGWDNFKHIVLLENLTHDVACECEKYLIAKYHTNDINYGYNMTIGGDGRVGAKHSEQAKLKISEASKAHWKDDNFRDMVITKLKGHRLSAESIQKVREKQIGKYISPEVRKKISDANKGKTAWNKGITGVFHHSEETKRKISESSKGKTILEEQKLKGVQTRRANGSYAMKDETKEKLRLAALNMTEEQKKKISESVKQRWKDGAYANMKRTKVVPWNKGLTKDDPRLANCVRKSGEFKHSEDAKLKMSMSHKGIPAHNRKQVMCIETGVIYVSVTEAMRQTQISNISKAARSGNVAGGFHWRYL